MSKERAEPSEPRRRFLLALSTLGATTLAACSKRDDAAAAVTGRNHDAVVETLDELSTALDDLDAAIGRFDDDDWRDVVPAVRSAADDVGTAADQLRSLLANQR